MTESTLTPVRQHLSLENLITVLTVAYWLSIIWYGISFGIPRPQYTIMFVGGGLVIYALDQIAKEDTTRARTTLLAVSMLVVIVPTTYLFVTFRELYSTRPIVVYQHEYILAAVLLVTILALAYHEFGLGFMSVVGFVLVYSYFGPHFPGLLSHGGLSIRRILETSVLDISGLYGEISRIVAAWVALFLLYAGLLKAYGALDLITRGAIQAAGLLSSGVAQSAVVASMIVGSINGAQTANAAMTGSFTIPMMKEGGLPGRVAGAIEAVASSGGQVMPPVMGSAAFVMASILGFTYAEILVAGLIPAVVYYVTVAIAVHFTSKRYVDNLTIDRDEYDMKVKTRVDFGFDALKFGIPFVVLVYTLGIAQWTVVSSALMTCAVMVATGIGVPVFRSISSNARDTAATLKETLVQTVEGFRHGAVVVAPIAMIIAVINVVVDLLNVTGMPGTLSLALIELSGGVLIFAAILAMVLCFILGMGMPVVAAYTLVAILIAPTFTGEFNIPTLAAHYFVLYAAVLSGITPPIAIAVVVTSGIAKSNFWLTCLEAIRVGATLFVVPIAFLFKPQLIIGGLTVSSLSAGLVVLAGGLTIIYGMNFVRDPTRGRAVSIGTRGVYLAAGIAAVIHPSVLVQFGALLLAVALYVVHRGANVRQVRDLLDRTVG